MVRSDKRGRLAPSFCNICSISRQRPCPRAPQEEEEDALGDILTSGLEEGVADIIRGDDMYEADGEEPAAEEGEEEGEEPQDEVRAAPRLTRCCYRCCLT